DGVLNDPKLIAAAFDLVRDKLGDGSSAPKNGFYPELSNMVTGAGWLAAGPGYRREFSDGRVLVDGSAALSWHLYKMAQGRVELPKLADGRLLVGAQGMWQDETQVNYFGLGFDRRRSVPVPVPDTRRRRIRDVQAGEFSGDQRRVRMVGAPERWRARRH